MTINKIVFYALGLICLLTTNILNSSAQVIFGPNDQRPTLHNSDYSSIQDYIARNTHYPELAKFYNTQGQVMIIAIVDTDGSIKDARISKEIGRGCGNEALRVVSTMPKLSPAMHDGKPIKIYLRIPVVFKLPEVTDEVEKFDSFPDVPASFPGGDTAYNNFIKKNLKIPIEEAEWEGRLYASLKINAIGKIVDVKIIKGAIPQIDSEVIKVLKNMPIWNPALKNGHPIGSIRLLKVVYIKKE